jgi:MoxR-like ATPase
VELGQVSQLSNRLLDEVERAVVGKRDALELLLLGLLADGHVLIEDFPGLAKTLIARAFAQVTSIGLTASSCGWRSVTRPATTSGRCSRSAPSAASTRSS